MKMKLQIILITILVILSACSQYSSDVYDVKPTVLGFDICSLISAQEIEQTCGMQTGTIKDTRPITNEKQQSLGCDYVENSEKYTGLNINYLGDHYKYYRKGYLKEKRAKMSKDTEIITLGDEAIIYKTEASGTYPEKNFLEFVTKNQQISIIVDTNLCSKEKLKTLAENILQKLPEQGIDNGPLFSDQKSPDPKIGEFFKNLKQAPKSFCIKYIQKGEGITIGQDDELYESEYCQNEKGERYNSLNIPYNKGELLQEWCLRNPPNRIGVFCLGDIKPNEALSWKGCARDTRGCTSRSAYRIKESGNGWSDENSEFNLGYWNKMPNREIADIQAECFKIKNNNDDKEVCYHPEFKQLLYQLDKDEGELFLETIVKEYVTPAPENKFKYPDKLDVNTLPKDELGKDVFFSQYEENKEYEWR